MSNIESRTIDEDSVDGSVIAIHTVGQTPRADLTEPLVRRLRPHEVWIRGALDGLDADQIPPCGRAGYPLETRLSDGTRVVVDAAFLAPRLRRLVSACDDHAAAHLVLCAGSFERLKARRPLFQPFDVAVAALVRGKFRSLEVLVPFAAQAAAAQRKWQAAGFAARPHVLAASTGSRSVGEWLRDQLAGERADAVVIDYFGTPARIRLEMAAAIELPLFDVGELSIDELMRALRAP